MVRIKRVYDPPAPSDGKRILIDRLWPRGLTKTAARVDVWLKDVSPSPQLRTWFAHDPAKFEAFKQRYLEELESNPAVPNLRSELSRGPATLVYGARDLEHNDAVVLKQFLEQS